MRFLAKGMTTGSPVMVAEMSCLAEWVPEVSYSAVLRQSEGLWFQGIQVPGFRGVLFHQEVDGNFHLFVDDLRFAVISEAIAEEQPITELAHIVAASPMIENETTLHTEFGGNVAVFDAAIPGQRILDRYDGRRIAFSVEDTEEMDVLITNVLHCTWSVGEIHFADSATKFDGIVFEACGQKT